MRLDAKTLRDTQDAAHNVLKVIEARLAEATAVWQAAREARDADWAASEAWAYAADAVDQDREDAGEAEARAVEADRAADLASERLVSLLKAARLRQEES